MIVDRHGLRIDFGHGFDGGLVDDLLQVGRQAVVPFLAHRGVAEDHRLADIGDEFRGVLIVHGVVDHRAGDGAVDGALLQRRQHVAERHRHRRDAEPAEGLALELRGEDAELLALEIGEMADRRFRDDRRRLRREQADAVQALVGAEPEHQFAHVRVGGQALRLGQRIDQSRRRHNLETLVDAGIEFRRRHHALDGAELSALDLPRDRAQLARRINLGLDAAVGFLVDVGGEILGELVQRLIEGGERYFHYDWRFVLRRLVLRRCAVRRQRQSRRDAGDGGCPHHDPTSCEAHAVLPVRRFYCRSEI